MNQHADIRTASETELRIIDGAIQAVIRFGPRKTTMNDIAKAAGLTRQTVYVSFGAKDDVLAEVVGHIGRQQLSQLAVAWEYSPQMIDKLRAYARIVTLDAYDELVIDEDPLELIAAYNDRGKRAYHDLREAHVEAWVEQLAPLKQVLSASGQTPGRVARFIVTSSFTIKATIGEHGQRQDMLGVLHSAILALTAKG